MENYGVEKTRAYCGIKCETCPLYIVTQNNDVMGKDKLAKEWGKNYKLNLTVEDMICNGCKSERVFLLCRKCDIVKCNKEKNINRCIECGKYPCNRIMKFYKYQERSNSGIIIE